DRRADPARSARLRARLRPVLPALRPRDRLPRGRAAAAARGGRAHRVDDARGRAARQAELDPRERLVRRLGQARDDAPDDARALRRRRRRRGRTRPLRVRRRLSERRADVRVLSERDRRGERPRFRRAHRRDARLDHALARGSRLCRARAAAARGAPSFSAGGGPVKLYYSPGACSRAVRIALHEAGIAFEGVLASTKTHRLPDGSDYYAINPKGYVPLLELDDGQRLTEAQVILQWVADQKPERGLAPPAGTMA